MERDWKGIAERLLAEEPMPVTRAAKLVPCNHGRRGYCSANALVGWILRGKRGVFLDGYRGPGKTWWTSAAAIQRFLAELSRAESDRSASARKPTPGVAAPFDSPASRERRNEKAKQRLRELGCNV